MVEQLPRKRAARKGHRSSATRTMTQTRALLDVEGDKDLIKLRQKRQSLRSKLDVLSTLDKEILELTEPEGMEEEILRADEVHDQLEQCSSNWTKPLVEAGPLLQVPTLQSPWTRMTIVPITQTTTQGKTVPVEKTHLMPTHLMSTYLTLIHLRLSHLTPQRYGQLHQTSSFQSCPSGSLLETCQNG